MRRLGLVSVLVLAGALACAGPVLAQEAAAAGQSVESYPPAFFADQRPNTAMDMVGRLPGFTFDSGSSVRGFAGAAGNVLINGQRPTSKNDDLNSILTRIPAGSVERIDVIRGGAEGIDMQGKAVVANVILKKTSGFSGVFAVASTWREEGRNYPEMKLEGTWQDGDVRKEASFNGSRFFDDGTGGGRHVLTDLNAHTVDASPMQAYANGWQENFNTAWESPVAGGRFRANLMLQDQIFGDRFVDVFPIAGRQTQIDTQDKTTGEVGLHYSHPISSTLTYELFGLQQIRRMGFVSTFDTPSESDLFGLRTSSGESIARAVLHWTPSNTLQVETGGEFAYNFVNTHTLFMVNGAAIAIPAANVRVDEKRGEVFANATWRPTPKLTLEAGLRVEDSTIGSTGDVVLSKSLIFPKPRVLLTWSPNPDNQVRLRIEREVGQLDFNSFVASSTLNGTGITVGNPNLEPSQDWAFEAAYERHFWGKGAVVVTARHMILQDVVDRVPIFAPSGTFDSPGNIGGGTEDDFGLSLTLPLDRLFIPGGVLTGVGTWRFSRVTDPATHETREISGQHQLDGELHFAQDLPQWRLNWGFDAFRGWTEHYYRFNEVDTNKLGTFVVGFVEYKYRPDLSFRWEFSNLGRRPFDLTREVYPGLRGPGVQPSLIDFQERNNGMGIRFRVRKTF